MGAAWRFPIVFHRSAIEGIWMRSHSALRGRIGACPSTEGERVKYRLHIGAYQLQLVGRGVVSRMRMKDLDTQIAKIKSKYLLNRLFRESGATIHLETAESGQLP